MKDWIPLFQTIIESVLPLVLVIILLIIFGKKVSLIANALVVRINQGAPVKFGSVLDVGAAPDVIQSGKADAAATSEGTRGSTIPTDIKEILQEKEYPPEINEEIYLVHVAQVIKPYTGPRTGIWSVRAYVEAYTDEKNLDNIESVTYRLHDTFTEKVVATKARNKAFEIWFNVYGEFNLVAYVKLKDESHLWITRYIDLPGRPTN